MTQKHGLLLFLTSCIPGCGQMYQGYMKRGLSLMLIPCVLFTLAIFLGASVLALFILPVWLYAFFDSYNLRTQIVNGAGASDEFLFGLSDMDSEKLSALCKKRHSLIGWGLVLFGGCLLYSSVVDQLGWFFHGSWLYDLLNHLLPRVVLTLLVIALGLWFIRGPQAPAADIPAFVPPAEPEAPEPAASAAPAEDAPATTEEVPHENV